MSDLGSNGLLVGGLLLAAGLLGLIFFLINLIRCRLRPELNDFEGIEGRGGHFK